MIAVLDSGLGNILSVAKAFEEVAGQREVLVTNRPEDLERASHIILPGVGNFLTGMKNLKTLDLIKPLESSVLENKTPFLGICLGMQLLTELGEEYGHSKGLGWIPGRVRMLNAGGFKLPHLGWQDIEIERNNLLFNGIGTDHDYYFVHSYVVDCPEKYVTAWCTYGERFPAAIEKDNIHATQFHPEKSRESGLKILSNFVRGQECSKSEWFQSFS
jgi:glutamine amidotransferase